MSWAHTLGKAASSYIRAGAAALQASSDALETAMRRHQEARGRTAQDKEELTDDVVLDADDSDFEFKAEDEQGFIELAHSQPEPASSQPARSARIHEISARAPVASRVKTPPSTALETLPPPPSLTTPLQQRRVVFSPELPPDKAPQLTRAAPREHSAAIPRVCPQPEAPPSVPPSAPARGPIPPVLATAYPSRPMIFRIPFAPRTAHLAPRVSECLTIKSNPNLVLFAIEDGILRDPKSGKAFYHVLFDSRLAHSTQFRYNELGERTPAGLYGIITPDLVPCGVRVAD